MRPYLEKLFTEIGLVEWLKVKALSSSPSTKKKKKKKVKMLKTKNIVTVSTLDKFNKQTGHSQGKND
jgi:hypothetical protein